MSEPDSNRSSIETVDLTRRFGALNALAGVTLRVADGEAVALFGPNGAGKTTLIRILTLALRPTAGEVRLAGLDVRREDREIRQRIGVISHQSFLYDDLTARQNLDFFGQLYGVSDPAGRANELLDAVGLGLRADDPVGTYSRGMQQRASLARALVHDPQILFLDEPYTGLDPHGARTLTRTLEQLRHDRKTVLIATHDLKQGLDLSDRWIILSRGRIAEQGRSAGTDPLEFERSYLARVDAPRRLRRVRA